ncbi:N-6 DNA methylase [Planococcus soli]|uniref:N-6 DNA methylase n=1 Tax=Planococcus soli TaxID=2666072 RepID=UPI00163D5CD6|nr:N-6 DNA methylase [Planococcus soli]
MNENKIWQIAEALRGTTNSENVGPIILTGLSIKHLEETNGDRLPEKARLAYLIKDASNTTENLIQAFYLIEEEFPELKNVYNSLSVKWKNFDNKTIFEVLLSIYKEPIKNYMDVAFELRNTMMKLSGKVGGEHLTPHSVNQLLVSLLNIESETSFYDGTAGYGGTLLEVLKQHPEKNVSLYGQDFNQESWALGKLFLLLANSKKAEFLLGDTLTEPQFIEKNRVKKFDYIAMAPPFALKLKEQQYIQMTNDPFNRFSLGDLPKSSADMAFLLHALSSMSGKGRAILLVNSGVLFRGGLEKNIRQNLIDTDQIEAVIALTSNLLHNAGISINLLVLNKNKSKNKLQKIQFIQANELFVEKNKARHLSPQHINRIHQALDEGLEEEGFSTLVPLSELEENLNVARYIQNNQIELEGEGNYRIRLDRLEENKNQLVEVQALGTIYRGLNITSKTGEESEDGEYKLIKLSDVQDGKILMDELKSVTMKTNFKPSLYQVQAGDVIISSRGNNIKVAVIPPHEGTVLLSQNFIGIRPKNSSVNPHFLQAYMESPIGQYQLSSLMGGSTVQVLNQKLLGTLEILIPSLEIQEAASVQYKEDKERYEATIHEAKQQLMDEKAEMYKKIGIASSFDLIE